MDLQLSHREQSEGENGKLAQLYLFFHAQDCAAPAKQSVLSGIAVAACRRPGHKWGIAAE